MAERLVFRLTVLKNLLQVGVMQSIAVYCGASCGDQRFQEQAHALGCLLARRGIRLVYGGGGIGLMGILADAVLSQGGEAIGVIPRFLNEHELGHRHLTELVVVETMHERKAKMIALAEGFIAMPGGFGTLEELAEVLAWSQLGIHCWPCGLLNVHGFYDGLIQCCDGMLKSGLLRLDDRNRLIAAPDAATLLDEMANWRPPKRLKFDSLRKKEALL